MTIKPVKQKVTPKELDAILAKIPRTQKFIGWSPVGVPNGVTLHNTYNPNLAKVEAYLKAGKWNEAQLIDNWWVNYIHQGWYSGPHLFVFPTGIYIGTSLEQRGTHSPSFNKSRYGIEMIGDYEKETLPFTIKTLTVQAIACLFRHMGLKPDADTFKFHFEDPRTSHPCPGKNVRDKSMWINLINKELA